MKPQPERAQKLKEKKRKNPKQIELSRYAWRKEKIFVAKTWPGDRQVVGYGGGAWKFLTTPRWRRGGAGTARVGHPGTRAPHPVRPVQIRSRRLNAFGLVLWVDGNVSSHGPNGGHIEEL